tara:strand:+ start:1079 stop:1402 length:324 start_codon:yes stop_codon:yes gene_type:complete
MESVFKNLDLSDARNEGESFEDYKARRKKNKLILKMYKRHGREMFTQAFPQGVTYEDLDQKPNELKEGQELTAEINTNPGETFIPADEPVNFNLDEQTEKRIFGESK